MKSIILHGSLLFVGLMMMFWLAGCDRKPDRAEVPTLDPAAIASGAMAAYDTNSDGSVAGEELEKAASITDHAELTVKMIDKNGDGQISKEEVQNRVQEWIDSKVGILSFHCLVKLDGKPLEGATVKYVPESFMGGAVEEATGTTDETGAAVLAIAQEKLPSHLKGINGMRSGFYKVQITHPTTSIPAKYNTETILGHEVASDSVGSINVVHELSSR
jgi:hypothetical protein